MACMPAISADTLTLPRITVAGPADTERAVRSVTTGPHGYEGEGFPVVRAFAGVPAATLDPFVHMDQMGEVEYEPGEPRGTSWHPHRGFETVTYMIDGRFAHQDSHGGGGLITDGATQWMTAGSGILHIETPPADLVESGGVFHGIQLWVNLPRAAKFAPPKYQAIEGNQVALLSSADGGALVRIIAGDIGDYSDSMSPALRLRGPGSTYTPITLAHATIEPGSTAECAVEPRLQRAGVRVVRARHCRIGRSSHPAGSAGGARSWRSNHRDGFRCQGWQSACFGGSAVGRQADS